MLGWGEPSVLELDDFASVPSFDMHGELALALADRVGEHCRRGDVVGVVVTHGTDTMEESVYTIDRLLDSEKPVVLTGAQRGADQPDTDGPRNLRDAIRVALSPEAAGRGAMIAFAGEVHAAREARKVHTSALAAFDSPAYGPLGHVDGECVAFARRPDRRPPLPPPASACPRSISSGSTPGATTASCRASLAAGAGRSFSRERAAETRTSSVLPGVEGGGRRGRARGRLLPLRRGTGRAGVRARGRQGSRGGGCALRRRPGGAEGARARCSSPSRRRARRRRRPWPPRRGEG